MESFGPVAILLLKHMIANVDLLAKPAAGEEG